MKLILRHTALLVVAALASWWMLGRPTSLEPRTEKRPIDPALEVALMPVLEAPASAGEPAPESETPVAAMSEPTEVPEPGDPEPEVAAAEEPEEAPAEEDQPAEAIELTEALDPAASEDVPPPAELGAPDAEGELAAEAEAPQEPVSDRRDSSELMADPDLQDAARQEIAGEVRRGYATVLLARPEDQLAIAQHFGEEVVLVPRAALDPDAPGHYFRLGQGGVERVEGPPPLERYRQYRDLFDYEYARLPASLRTLRRSVLSRNEIYLFAALIPLGEWALVVGRREEAAARAELDVADVRRFVLRYVPAPGDGFDVRVEEIVLADGKRVRPETTLKVDQP